MTLTQKQSSLLFGITVALVATSQPAFAEKASHPPVRMLVPCPVGSPTDVSARSIARWWSENSERTYYVENLPIRTASVDTRAIVEALVDKNTMLFDLGNCANEATTSE